MMRHAAAPADCGKTVLGWQAGGGDASCPARECRAAGRRIDCLPRARIETPFYKLSKSFRFTGNHMFPIVDRFGTGYVTLDQVRQHYADPGSSTATPDAPKSLTLQRLR